MPNIQKTNKMKIPLKITKIGKNDNIQIFLEGPDAHEWGHSFYMKKATNNPEMTEVSKNKVSFRTTEQNLRYALFQIFISILWNSDATAIYKAHAGGFAPEARKMADLEFDAITEDLEEIRKVRKYNPEPHSMGAILTRDENAFFAGCKG